MIVRKFMQWAATAASAERAEGAGSLARAYLYADFAPQDRSEAEVASTALLDDPAPSVRKALSEAFASAAEAPIAIVVALANDQSDVAAPVLSRSPLLGDGELIDCAAIGDAFAQAYGRYQQSGTNRMTTRHISAVNNPTGGPFGASS